MNMNLEMFGKKIIAEINRQYPEYLVNEINNKKMNNVEIASLEISTPGDNVGPVIPLAPYFEEFNRGADVQEIAQEIIKCCQGAAKDMQVAKKELDDLHNYELMKDKICYRVVETARNTNTLAELVSFQYLNLSLVFYLSIDVGSIKISKKMLTDWGVTEKDIFEVAALNTPVLNPLVFMGMQQIFSFAMTGISNNIDLTSGKETCENHNDRMFVLTNKEKLYGAAVIFYPDILEQLYRFFGNKNFYILPSSMHELIIVSVDTANGRHLRAMVQEVNRDEVNDDEILSDDLYVYCGDKKEIVIFE